MNLDYSGLYLPFQSNVPLSELDKGLQLKQKEKLDAAPNPRTALIRFNSTYLESTDKYFDSRGLLTPLFIFAFCLGLFLSFFPLAITIHGMLFPSATSFVKHSLLNPVELAADIFMLVAGAIFTWYMYKLFLGKDMFNYTHYPIRLNRKNRMVYVFRSNGTILSVPWDEVFFTTGRGQKSRSGLNQYWDIRGYVLDKDRETIKETFSFSVVDDNPDRDLLDHWEFLRRYMEEGPEKLANKVQYCWPIDKQKENFITGIKVLLSVLISTYYKQNIRTMPISKIISAPLLLAYSLIVLPFIPFRWIAMQSCKLPAWPQEIEDACQIDPDDPYVRDANNSSSFLSESAVTG